MPKKGKKRREAERRAREREAEVPAAPEGEAARLARAKAKAEHEVERLRRKAQREGRTGLSPVFIGVAGVGTVIAVVIFAVALMAGGGSGSSPATPTPHDPRLKGTPTNTVNIEATGEEEGSYYIPDTLTIKAGEETEIRLTNTAVRVSHNLRVSGEDGKYETDDPKNVKDDWV
ncbi:MAG TPA: hypothetical protein VLS25_01985, partial [Dehalococcoidia bacterium]|nr:hypothetical protein [Dehalococcoidia bacterium]